jgi:VanZ family protein
MGKRQEIHFVSRSSGLFRALLIVIALILYGCLYPFRFHSLPPGGWNVFWHAWPAGLDRFMARDALVNVLLYFPFGMVAFLALDRVRTLWLRVLLPLILAVFLSTTIELVQLMDFTRTSSVFDVASNTAGTALGIAAGCAYAARLCQIITRTEQRLTPAAGPPLLLFCVWLGYQLFPLFPSMSLFTMRAKWKIFYTQSPFSFSGTLLTAIEWLAMAAVLRKLLPEDKSRFYIPALVLFLPARLFLLGRNFTPSELAGAVIACALWTSWPADGRRSALILSSLMVAALILQGLSPYRFSSTPHHFSWIPFAGFIETGPDWGAVMFLKKTFWYGTTIWVLQETGAGYLRPAISIGLLLAAIEWIQRYLPGRTPEISDPVLAVLLGILLYLFQQRSPASRPGTSLTENKLPLTAASLKTPLNR